MTFKNIMKALVVIITVATSITAIVLSWQVNNSTFRSPFNLEVTVGNPMLHKIEWTADNKCSLAITLPIDLVNTGAHGGTVTDAIIRLDTQSQDFPSWCLKPVFFVKEYSPENLQESDREVFHSLYIQGKERIYRNFLFSAMYDRCLDPPSISESNVEVPIGNYTMTLFLSDSSSPDYRIAYESSFILTENNVVNIADNRVIVPQFKEIIAARDRLSDWLYKTPTE